MMPALICASARRLTATWARRPNNPPAPIGTDRLGARDEFADRGEHLAVAFAGLAVGTDEMSLHHSQHEEQRDRDADRDHRQQPVVGQHHGGHDQHQGAVDQPRQPTPLEEPGEGLDVARDAGHQRSALFVVVVGQAESVDVPDQACSEVVERLLGAGTESHDRRALAHGRHQLCDETDHGAGDHEPHPDVGATDDAAVDRLLDDDRHDDPTTCPGGGEQPGQPQALPQHRGFGEAATDRIGRRETAQWLGHRVASLFGASWRSASNASTSRR